jgi:Domain of unknown function (DUF1929)
MDRRTLTVITAAIAVGVAAWTSSARPAPAPDDRVDLEEYQADLLDPQAIDGTPEKVTPGATQGERDLAPAAPNEPIPIAEGGRWRYAASFPAAFNAIHAITGPNGKILVVAGSGNRRETFEAGQFQSYLWNTITGTRRLISTPDDLFCSGHVLLPDGRALILGGTTAYQPFKGGRFVYAFDFGTEEYDILSPMEVGRWYPSVTTNATGQTVITSGFDEDGILASINEIFDYRTNTVTRLPGTRQFSLYPHIHLSSRGSLFFSGASYSGAGRHPPGFWQPSSNGFSSVSGLSLASDRNSAASCFVRDVRDQNLMVMGGGFPTTASTRVIKLNAASAAYRAGPALRRAKAYLNCVNLPDGSLLELGGGLANTIDGASLEVSLLRGVGGSWIRMNPLPTGEHRVYHSIAFLRDDGAVISMTSNPTDGAWSTSVLVYRPPYFYRGPRPEITRAPTEIVRGGTYVVRATTSNARLTRVTLTTPSAPTHASEPNQRYISFPVVDGSVRFGPSRAVLPAGWYRLWAVDSLGRPSAVARWVHLTG